MSKDFDQQKEELLQEVRSVLDDVEELYHSGVEEGSKEVEQLRGKLQRKLGDFEEVAAERVKHTARQADQLVQDKPYYAMGFAALAGLVVGVLLNRR